MAGMFGGGKGNAGAAPQGGMGVGDYGSSWSGNFANGKPTGGYDDMMAGKSAYDVQSPAQPSGMNGESDNTGLLEMLAGAGQGGGGGGGGETDYAAYGQNAGMGSFIGMPALMAMGNKHQARNQNARQAYRNGLLGG